MMFYQFSCGLTQVQLDVNATQLQFGFVHEHELSTLAKQLQFSMTSVEEYQHTKRIFHKMDSYYGYDFGIFHVLKHKPQGFDQIKVGLYITAHHVLVIVDDTEIEGRIFDAVDKMNEKTFCLEHVVSAVLNGMIAGNLEMIEDMENRLADIDEDIIANHTDGFTQRTRSLRNELLFLTHYYEQLIDVSEELLQDENDFFADEQVHHLRMFADRVNRLHGNVHVLKEYMLQIREACQSQVDMNLNRIMYFFTVITTIFLPLTLIVGWYGMNFTNMPELTWQYGYTCVIVISIVIILVCLWLFRKKKLLGK